MLKVKPIGDWQKISKTLLHRKQRLKAMQTRLMRDLVKKFQKEIRKPLPNDDEMRVYSDSIVRREIGGLKKGEVGYAIIVDPKPLEMAEIGGKTEVFYVVASGEFVDALGMLLVEHSPWAKNRLPKNVGDVKGISLVHREVTEHEVEKIRGENDRVLKNNKRQFAKANAQLEPVDEPKKPKSMPDIAFKAMRMEFGINGRHIPHWGRAYRRRMKMLESMLKGKKKYTRYILDPNFNGWTQKPKRWKRISGQRFKTQYSKFEKKIERT